MAPYRDPSSLLCNRKFKAPRLALSQPNEEELNINPLCTFVTRLRDLLSLTVCLSVCLISRSCEPTMMTSNCRSGKRLRQRMMMIMLLQVGFLRPCCTMQFYALASLASPASLLFAGGSGCGWRPMGLLLCKAPFSYLSLQNNNHHSLSLPPLTTTIVRKNWSKEWIMKRGEEDKKKGYKNSLWILCFWDEIKIPAAASLSRGGIRRKFTYPSIHGPNDLQLRGFSG